jgi:hypothetical protein
MAPRPGYRGRPAESRSAVNEDQTELHELFRRFHELEEQRRANGYDRYEHAGTPAQRSADLHLAHEEDAVQQAIIDIQRRRLGAARVGAAARTT